MEPETRAALARAQRAVARAAARSGAADELAVLALATPERPERGRRQQRPSRLQGAAGRLAERRLGEAEELSRAIHSAQHELSALSDSNATHATLVRRLQTLAAAETAADGLEQQQHWLLGQVGRSPTVGSHAAEGTPPERRADAGSAQQDRGAALRKWRRSLRCLAARRRTKLLRAVVAGWRLAAATASTRRRAVLDAHERMQARADAAGARESLRRWRAAYSSHGAAADLRARGVQRMRRRADTRSLRAAVVGWRWAVERSQVERQLTLSQAMHRAAETAVGVERALHGTAEAATEAKEGERRSVAQELEQAHTESQALRARLEVVEAEREAERETEHEASKLLQVALAERQDVVLERDAAVARAAAAMEAAAALQQQLEAAQRALAASAETLAACENHGLVRRTDSGALLVEQLKVSSEPTPP